MDINKFNNALLYSNKNVEKLAKKLINESANAVLMEMFDDKCILADHTTGQIFEAKYEFDGKTFTFDNFDEISLEKSNDSLKEAIKDYFDDDNFNITEAYENSIADKSDVFEDSLTEALAGKNMDNVIDYSDLSGINKELGEFKKSDVFKVYTERLEESPTDSIKMFDWNHAVKVALIDEDCDTVLNKTMKAKAKKLRGDASFKNALNEAAKDALDGDNSGLEALLEENTSIVSLDKAELKELVGFSVVGSRTLMENRNKIAQIVEDIIENDSELSEKKALYEAEEEDDNASNAPEATEEDIESVKKALETAKSKAKDKKLIDKIDSLIDSLDESSKAGETDVGSLKEAISILSL